MVEKIRWGIMSTGNIANAFARGLLPLEDAELLAVCSRTQESADAFGDKYGIPRRYGSYEELAADPDIDVVYIATPHSRHHHDAMLCLNHGKAILCEKAFTINLREANEVLETAKARNLLVVEALWTRFLPAFRKILSLIDEGAIGEVKMLNANFGFRPEYDPKGRLFNPEVGGGALLDVTVYPVMLALTLFGEPRRIQSEVLIGETGVDEAEAMLFSYDKGVMAVLNSTLQADLPCDAFITGTTGRIHIRSHWWATQYFTIVRPDGSEEVYDMPFEHNGYSYEAAEVMRCLREGRLESELMPWSFTRLLMGTMDKLRADWGVVYANDRV